MRTFLLATTVVIGFAGLAHAQSFSGGVNGSLSAASQSGQNAQIWSGLNNNNGNLTTGITTAGNSFSQSTIDPLSGQATSYSNSWGNINGNATNGLNAGFDVQRVDQATTGASLSGWASGSLSPVSGWGNYTLSTNGQSGQALHAFTYGGTGGGYADVTSSGDSFSKAKIGLTSTGISNTSGSINGVAGWGGFDGERIDNTDASVQLQGGLAMPGASVNGNLSAEANAGHDLKLDVTSVGMTSTQLNGNPSGNFEPQISDNGSAFSRSTLNPFDGTSTSTSGSFDHLQGTGHSADPQNQGFTETFSGQSIINAQTSNSLSGSLSGSLGSPSLNVFAQSLN